MHRFYSKFWRSMGAGQVSSLEMCRLNRSTHLPNHLSRNDFEVKKGGSQNIGNKYIYPVVTAGVISKQLESYLINKGRKKVGKIEFKREE